MLDDLVGVIETLKARIQGHRPDLQANETRTRMALIDPLLQALGWDTTNPALVLPEYDVSGKRADYALLKADGNPAAVVEAKKLGESLVPHRSQMVGYSVEFGVPYAGLTDGDHWELYDVFQKTSLDKKKVLDVSLAGMPSHQCALQLLLLWRPNLASGDPKPANGPIIEKTEVCPPPPPPPGWIPIAEFQSKSGEKPPPAIRFPGEEERAIQYWNRVLVEVAEWLVRKGTLTAQKCPIKREGASRYLVHSQSQHPDGSDFISRRELSNGLFLETNAAAKQLVDNARFLLERLEEDGSQVLLRLG